MTARASGRILLSALVLILLTLDAGPVQALDRDEVRRASELTAGYLMKSQEEDGLFTYAFDFAKDRPSSKNNVVRQAGAGAVLAEYYVATGDRRVEPALIAAIEGFAAKSIPYGQGKVMTLNGARRGARIGGTALALLTELRYHEGSGDNRFESQRRDWLNGLLAVRVPGGGFWKYPEAREELSFFNGEAWLALAHYHRMFPDDEEVRRTLSEIDEIFMKRYGAEEKGGFFLWGLQAAATRYASGAGEALHRYALEKVRFYLDERRPKFRKNSMHCASMEGLVAVLLALQSDDPINAEYRALEGRLRDRVEREMAKHLTFQIQPGQKKIHHREGVYLYAERLSKFAGAFLTSRTSNKTRVDFTWHCLSSLVKYGRVLEADGNTPKIQ